MELIRLNLHRGWWKNRERQFARGRHNTNRDTCLLLKSGLAGVFRSSKEFALFQRRLKKDLRSTLSILNEIRELPLKHYWHN
jgi:hypothetical protein